MPLHGRAAIFRDYADGIVQHLPPSVVVKRLLATIFDGWWLKTDSRHIDGSFWMGLQAVGPITG